jgi:hypothetical protein
MLKIACSEPSRIVSASSSAAYALVRIRLAA